MRVYHFYHYFICLVIIMSNSLCMCENNSKDNYIVRRRDMVKSQIERRGVKDKKVLEAMMKVERHRFVPETQIREAYDDHPLPIGEGQTISQPYIVAFMTEVLDLDPSDRVLEVGTGSGYQAAVLAGICDSVYTIEIIEPLAIRAKKVLSELGYKNIFVKIGDGYEGWKERSPFDAIIVTCAPTHIPQALKDQLAEGGKMIIPVGGEGFVQELVLLIKEKGAIRQKDILPVRFVPMIRDDGSSY